MPSTSASLQAVSLPIALQSPSTVNQLITIVIVKLVQGQCHDEILSRFHRTMSWSSQLCTRSIGRHLLAWCQRCLLLFRCVGRRVVFFSSLAYMLLYERTDYMLGVHAWRTCWYNRSCAARMWASLLISYLIKRLRYHDFAVSKFVRLFDKMYIKNNIYSKIHPTSQWTLNRKIQSLNSRQGNNFLLKNNSIIVSTT